MPKLISEQAKRAKRQIAASARKVNRVVGAIPFLSADKTARMLRDIKVAFPGKFDDVETPKQLVELLKRLQSDEARQLKQRYNF